MGGTGAGAPSEAESLASATIARTRHTREGVRVPRAPTHPLARVVELGLVRLLEQVGACASVGATEPPCPVRKRRRSPEAPPPFDCVVYDAVTGAEIDVAVLVGNASAVP